MQFYFIEAIIIIKDELPTLHNTRGMTAFVLTIKKTL